MQHNMRVGGNRRVLAVAGIAGVSMLLGCTGGANVVGVLTFVGAP